MFRTLWLNRELISSLVKRDLKTRYKSSALGFFWSLCKPLFIMAILFLVFGKIVPMRFERAYFFVPGDDAATGRGFAVHLMIGILLWSYFAGSLSEAAHSILANGNLIKKVKIPAEVFPVSTVIANLVHYILALFVLIPIILLLGFKITWLALTLPFLIVLLTISIAGFAFFLSATNVFYRDVASLTEVVLLGWFYVTPIFYPASAVWVQLEDKPRVFFNLYISNPMATICVVTRRVLFVQDNFTPRVEIADASVIKYLALDLAVSLAIYAVGRLVFQRLKSRFADEV